MTTQKPIRTFTLCDEEGTEYEVNEYPDHGIVSGKGYSQPVEKYKYLTSDNIDVFPTDDGYELADGTKLVKCE